MLTALCGIGVAGIARNMRLLFMKQRVNLVHVSQVCHRADKAAQQSCGRITSMLAFMPKGQWLPFYSLMHFRIALALAVLGQGGAAINMASTRAPP